MREDKAAEVLSAMALIHKFSTHSLSTYADYELADALQTAIEVLTKGGVTNWVPVSDHNPTRAGQYLATVDFGKYGRVSKTAYYDGDGVWDNFVVAWMPLPKPYREEK